VPAPQSIHTELTLALVVVEYVPAAHCTHVADDEAPAVVE
jgi:hypothetical protein